MSTKSSHRILAVEFRAGRIGYAVLETPLQLRDFGAAWFLSMASARSRIARLLRLSQPSVMVLRGARARYRAVSRRRRPILRIAVDEARKAKVAHVNLADEDFEAFFDRHSCQDKYEMAEHVGTSIPEMAWRIPPRPKFYDPEPRAILYFDSIALGMAYLELAHQGK